MKKPKLGVLILHGWTSSLDTVNGLVPPINALGLPISMPVLRGHGKTPDALIGVKWQDWVKDATAALDSLLTEVEHAVIVGHSMGGMLALYLAATHPQGIDSIVTAGSPGRMATPFAPGNVLHPLFQLVWPLVKTYKLDPIYADPELAKDDTCYRWCPVVAVKQLFDFSKALKILLPEVKVPALILQSKHDSTCLPKSADLIYTGISTPIEDKKIAWFEKTEHGMFQDMETKQVIQTVVDFIVGRMNNEHE